MQPPFPKHSRNARASQMRFIAIHDLPEHMMAEMEHFFTVYKQLEGKKTYVSKTEGHVAAREVIAKSIRAYNEKFGG